MNKSIILLIFGMLLLTSFIYAADLSYDEFNTASLNWSKWYNQTDGDSSYSPKIRQSGDNVMATCNYASSYACRYVNFISTSNFTDFTKINNMTLNATLNVYYGGGSCATTYATLQAFGNNLLELRETNNTQVYNSLIQLKRNNTASSLKFSVYQNNIYTGDITPTGSNNVYLHIEGSATAPCSGNITGIIEYVNYTLWKGINVTLNSPANNYVAPSQTVLFNASASPTLVNLTNMTIYVYYSNGSLFNTTTNTLTGNITNTTNWSISNFRIGNYLWSAYSCGLDGTTTYCNSYSSNLSFSLGAIIDNESYDTYVFDTDRKTFNLNITTISGSTLYSASFVYNGTSYPASIVSIGGLSYGLYRTIDIPAVTADENKTFYWRFNFDVGGFTTQNSPTKSHLVNRTIISFCNATWTNPIVNFTVYNESSPTNKINATLKGSFFWYLGSGTVVKNVSYNFAQNDTFKMCSNINLNYYTSSLLELKSTGFTDRTYQFNKEIYNFTTTQQNLYLMPSTEGRNIVIELKDIGFAPLKGYVVKVYRFYPEYGDYKLVHEDKTDIYGQVVSTLIESTVKYRIKFYDSNNTLKKSTEDISIACRSSVCILPFVIQDTSTAFDDLKNISNYAYSLSFNNNTNIVTVTWNDDSGKSATYKLYVERFLFNGSTVVCNTTSTASIGTLTCNVGSSRASYQAQFYRQEDGSNERRVAVISIKVGDSSKTFGIEGVFWSFVLLMTLVGVGIWNPPVAVVMYLGGFFILGIMGIIYLSPAVMAAELVLGILFIWAFRG